MQTGIAQAFSAVGISSQAALRDDKKIRRAAHYAYRKLPLVAFRATVKALVGKEGFEALVFRLRDTMLENGTMEVSWLDAESLKLIVSSIIGDNEKSA